MEKSKRWKIIPGYSGRYKVNTLGEIMNAETGRILKPMNSHHGYKRIQLYKGDGTFKTLAIHRIVASVFLDNRNCYKEINHINGNTSDNRAENLEWCDRLYNIRYGGRIEKMSFQTVMLDLGRNEIKRFASQKEASEKTGISQGSISNACSGRCKSAGGYAWKKIS